MLDASKIGTIDHIDLYSGLYSDSEFASGQVAAQKTKSRRISFKNELSKRFGSKHRDSENTRELMGERMVMGKAFGIVAICLFGPNLPTEKIRHADRFRIWKCAAKYCLTDESIEYVMNVQSRDPDMVIVYIQGLLTTALVSVRTDLPNSARSFGQNFVFSPGSRSMETQLHLGLDMTQSVMDQ